MIIKVSSAGDVTVDDYDLFTGFHVEADGDGAADRLAANPACTSSNNGRHKCCKRGGCARRYDHTRD